MSLSIAAFAYVGVEIVAAAALEVRVFPNQQSDNLTIKKTIKFSAVYSSFLVGFIYFFGGLLVTLNVRWDDPGLPRMSWIRFNETSSPSAFVIAAHAAQIPGLPDTLTVFLMITALTCANTNLYVASRTLFSLCKSLPGDHSQPWYIRFLSQFGQTNTRRVPLRAMVMSCIFIWVPFLYLSKDNSPGTTISSVRARVNQSEFMAINVAYRLLMSSPKWDRSVSYVSGHVKCGLLSATSTGEFPVFGIEPFQLLI